MKIQLNHVALSVKDFEWHIHFFHTVLGMSIKKSAGEKPTRKVWFCLPNGIVIELKECCV